MLEESLEFVFRSALAVAMVEVLLLVFVLVTQTLNVARIILAALLKEVEPVNRLVLAAALMSLDIVLVLQMFSAALAVAVDAPWEVQCPQTVTRLALPLA